MTSVIITIFLFNFIHYFSYLGGPQFILKGTAFPEQLQDKWRVLTCPPLSGTLRAVTGSLFT